LEGGRFNDPFKEASLQNETADTRRSPRLSLRIPITITSLDPAQSFHTQCNTVVVNAHGCGVLVPQRLENGTRVMVELQDEGRRTAGRIVASIPIGETWLLGLEFNTPENFWEIKDPPEDWISFK
jgi:hypothetical protein